MVNKHPTIENDAEEQTIGRRANPMRNNLTVNRTPFNPFVRHILCRVLMAGNVNQHTQSILLNMGNKNSGNRTHKPRASGAGRPPKSAKLRDGQRIGFWERAQHSERMATIKIIKRGTFQILRDNGEIITIITN